MKQKATQQMHTSKTWDDKVLDIFRPLWKKFKISFWILLFISLFLFAYLFNRIFINIHAGESGVLWKRFDNGIEPRVYGGGLWVINPFNIMHKYEVRTQQQETNFTVLSKNGLRINIKASVRFMPNRKTLYLLHDEVGPDYIERVVIPETQAAVRRVIGEYEPDDIYATQGNIVQNIVLMALNELQQRHVLLDDLLIMEIRLPEKIAGAISDKLTEEQRLLAYEYINERQKMEITRKRLEAEGIKVFQDTISKGLTPAYLRFKGINATLELAKSNNAKLVIIGNSKDGLPLILNTANETMPNIASIAATPPSAEATTSEQDDSNKSNTSSKAPDKTTAQKNTETTDEKNK